MKDESVYSLFNVFQRTWNRRCVGTITLDKDSGGFRVIAATLKNGTDNISPRLNAHDMRVWLKAAIDVLTKAKELGA